MFECAEPFLKGDLKPKKGKETIHFQSTTQTKTIIIAIIWHAMGCAVEPQCVSGLISTIKTKKLVIVQGLNFPQTTSRTSHTEEVQQLQETECEVMKTAKPLLKCHKRQVSQQKLAQANFIVTGPWKTDEGRWTVVCRELTLPHDNLTAKLVCALKDNVLIGQFQRIW